MDSQTSPAFVPAPPSSSGNNVTPVPLQNISASPSNSAQSPGNTPNLSSQPLPGGLPPRPAPAPTTTPISTTTPLSRSPLSPATPITPPPSGTTPPAPPASPTLPGQPGSTPVKPAQAPRSPIFMVLGVIVALLLLLGGGYYVWSMIGPQTAPSTPTPAPTTTPMPTMQPDMGPNGVGPGVACTMEAKLCPDGSYVGRSGPNCDFDLCPGEQSKGGMTSGSTSSGTSGSSGSTVQPISAPAQPTTPTTSAATWDTYKNPTYFLTFSYPAGWEVRDMKPYPRSDIKFRHAYGPRQGFTARGWVEASTLPQAELIEQVKKEEGGTATDQPGQMMGNYSVAIVRITKGTASVDHWFVRAHDYTYHFTATGTSSEVAEIAKSYKIQ